MNDEDVKLFLKECYLHAAIASDDLSNQNAAVIFDPTETNIFALAANSIPYGVHKTDQRIKERPTKYAYIEHAERNSIYKAAREGRCLRNCVMVCPWFACADCARAIVQSGIRKVYGHKQRLELTNVGRDKVVDVTTNRWVKTVEDGDVILQEAGIELYYYDGTIEGINVLVNEKRYTSI